MPELPEVQALVDFLTERTADLAVTATSSAGGAGSNGFLLIEW